jgi:hypothetical protein
MIGTSNLYLFFQERLVHRHVSILGEELPGAYVVELLAK